jgi:hypothetical protein
MHREDSIFRGVRLADTPCLSRACLSTSATSKALRRRVRGHRCRMSSSQRHSTEAHRVEYLKLLARIEERGREGSSRYASSPPDLKQCIHAIVLLRSSAWRETRFIGRLGSYLNHERLRESLRKLFTGLIPLNLTSIVHRRGDVRHNGTAPRTHIPGALPARPSPGYIGPSEDICTDRARYAIQRDVSVVASDHTKICFSGVFLRSSLSSCLWATNSAER